MAVVPVPTRRPIDAMASWHLATQAVCEAIASALQPHIPSGFRGRVEIHVENGVIQAHNVVVSGRPMQRAGERMP